MTNLYQSQYANDTAPDNPFGSESLVERRNPELRTFTAAGGRLADFSREAFSAGRIAVIPNTLTTKRLWLSWRYDIAGGILLIVLIGAFFYAAQTWAALLGAG